MLSYMAELFNKFAKVLVNVLPVSPFVKYEYMFSDIPFLGYLNWFIPIKDILIICGTWLTAIALFYMYSIVMRWVKMIGD